jgi:hypothetical protein
MTADEFRKSALELPDAVEGGHMDHPDFRVRGKIFATLGYPNDDWAMVKLAPDEQLALCAAKPKSFVPVKGAWGKNGATNVRLDSADRASVREALRLAHASVGKKR